MTITSERVGQTIVLTASDDARTVTLVLDVDAAVKLGTTLVMQATLAADGLDLPADFRPGATS